MRYAIAGLKLLIWVAACLVGFAIAVPVATWFWVAKDLPDPRAVLTLDPETCPDGSAGRSVRLADLKPFVAEAVIAAEQPGYWQQGGIPTLRIFAWTTRSSAHAMISDERPMPPRAPLAQSLVHIQFRKIELRRTVWWHAAQAVQSDRIELSLSKAEVLDAVVNHANFGHKTFGLVCASLFYFGKPPETLSISESALLAALLRGPSNYDPMRQPERARERRNLVIDGMLASGVILRADADRARADPLPSFKSGKK